MDLINQFRNYLFSGKSANITVKNYLADVKKFLNWYEKTTQTTFSVQAITSNTIEAFKIDNQKIFSPSSIERQLSSLRKFFAFLEFEGIISQNPLTHIQSLRHQESSQDPWHIKEFRNYLYIYNSSNLTIKNYIIDVKQFLLWACKFWNTANPMNKLTMTVIEDYKKNLILNRQFSIASVNRKVSSLRKYISWSIEHKLISSDKSVKTLDLQEILEIPIHQEISNTCASQSTQDKQVYSSIPPIRLLQKLNQGLLYGIDALFVTPLSELIIRISYNIWHLRGRPIFSKEKSPILNSAEMSAGIDHEIPNQAMYLRDQDIGNVKRNFTNRLIQWYKRYQNHTIARYFQLTIVIIFVMGIGFGLYKSFFANPKNNPILAAPTSPPRYLSFQGRLTDSSDNPIAVAKSLRFAIYSDPTASGTALLWQETDQITPDTDGVFSVLLGKKTGITQSLFGQNASLYLGVTIDNSPELSPRQQIATVAYALNTDTLQGLPPTTDSNVSGNTNVILALNSSGVLNLQGSGATSFQSSGGKFTIASNVLALTTAAGTNSNVLIQPDGTGLIDVRKPLVNSTQNNNIATAIGSVEVDDLFSVLSSSSGQSAFTLVQTGSGPLISASVSGKSTFSVGNLGDISSADYTTSGGIFYGTNTGLLSLSSQGVSGQCLTSGGSGSPTWSTCSTGSNANIWSSGSGAVYQNNTTQDLLLGSSATASAKIGFINIQSGTPTATLSAGTSGGIYLNAAGTLATTSDQELTLGDAHTGDIILGLNSGTNTVKIQPNAGGQAALIVNKQGAAGDIFTASVSGTPEFVINNTGNVGIGNSNPLYKLQVTDNPSATYSALIENTSTSNTTRVLALKTGVASPIDTTRWIDFLNGNGFISGHISGNGSNFAALTSGGGDYAEYYKKTHVDEDFSPGQMVCLDNQGGVTKCDSMQTDILGIVSNNYTVLGNATGTADHSSIIVGLLGQITTMVSAENGSIQPGDMVTASSVPGIGTKATQPGFVAGRALDNFSGSGIGTIKVSVQPGWYTPPNTTTQTLTTATDNLTMGSNYLRNYIVGVINGTKIISPLAEFDTIHTNIISPLSNDGISINGKVSVSENNNQDFSQTVLDVRGSASVAGTLKSKNLTVNSDATVSGTLFAHQIQADSILGLDKLVSTFSAQKNENGSTINQENPTPASSISAQPAASNLSSSQSAQAPELITDNQQPATDSSQLNFSSPQPVDNNFVDIASYSSYLAYVPQLSTRNAIVNQNLSVYGETTLSDTSIAGQLAIDGNFILSQNGINVLGQDLQIQPLRQGGVSFLGGLAAIDSNGNLTVDGNATVNGTLATNIISPLPGKDLTIRLGETNPVTSGADTTANFRNSGQKLIINNASGSAVFSVNSLGDLIASGTASVNKLNLSVVAPALAVSDTEVIATGSAGTTTIDKNQKEITIDTPLVTNQSLIYITPVGDTLGQQPFLLRQTPGQSFTVGTSQFVAQPIQFNWLIVN